MRDFILYLRDRLRDVGGPVTSGKLYELVGATEFYRDHRLDDFTRETTASGITLLLHGFNVSCGGGRASLSAYIRLLRERRLVGNVMAVLWPGDGWAKALSYPSEARDADDTADALYDWLSRNLGRRARVSFVAHSLGCRVAMTAARRLVTQPSAAQPILDRICLMAPAIDNDCLGRVGKACFREATLEADRIAVLASEQDLVLRLAYPLGDLTHTILGRGGWGSALGRTGPREKAPEVVARIAPVPLSRPDADVDHSDYLSVERLPAPEHAMARTEGFVADFLAGTPTPHWPVQR